MSFDIEKYRSVSVNTKKSKWGTRIVSESSAHKSVKDEAGNVVTTKDESQDVNIFAQTVRATTH